MTTDSSTKFTFRDMLASFGLLLFLAGTVMIVVSNAIDPPVNIPKGTILTVSGQTRACNDTMAGFGKAAPRPVGQITFTFVYNNRTYTNQDYDTTHFVCAQSLQKIGASIPVYFLQDDPAQSVLTRNALYVTRIGPLQIAALVLLGTGFLCILFGLSKPKSKKAL